MIRPCLFVLAVVVVASGAQRPSCQSPVYCQGDLLHVVQTAKIFNDSKTFVDMSMKNNLNVTLTNFDILMRKTNRRPSKAQIEEFVYQNFQMIGEMEDFYPRDFRPEPKIVREIDDKQIRMFLTQIVGIWPQLTRKISHHVFEHPETFSLIPVRNAFIIPGGRFREFYYWDSYWILKGLLLSDMKETAKGVIDNFLYMVDTYGFIPNGGRIYYLNRSQPPVLTLMMKDYVHYTKDFEFLRSNVKVLERELRFWLTKRVSPVQKNGDEYFLARFDSESDTPRPESYLEDLETCAVYENNTEDLHDCYADIKSGAESGWDFTSRWIFNGNGDPDGDLSKISTRRNVPVCLNSFLYKSFVCMHYFYVVLREPTDARYWLDLAEKWRHSIEQVLYHDEDGIWYDYDAKLNRPRKYFAASNFAPLWADAVAADIKSERGNKAVRYLKRYGGLDFHGVPSTLLPSGLQWDFPNAWAPYQNIVIFGLARSGDDEAAEFAKMLAKRWVHSNVKAFVENKVMFEKYDSVTSGQFGGGGEYHIQSGFGWTNGGIMEIIDHYFRVKRRKHVGLER
ncbi:trehalase-like [Cylas formicarius]|uniref:trehalase-like n=1 Tax=Cylas formicarius TaxID=197179 RepID=UPI002958A60E|nr:trehalase-like [Cylas formicarius]